MNAFPIMPEVEAGSDYAYQRLQARLDFFSETVLLSRYGREGTTTYPVAVADLAAVFADLSLHSGLLPANTVFWSQRGNQERLGIYRPARKTKLTEVELGSLEIPLPPLLFIGYGTSYRVFALKGKPTDPHMQLYAAPLPNVTAGGGGICSGGVDLPVCSTGAIEQALDRFLGGRFNNHTVKNKSKRYPDDIRVLWQELAGRRRYPLGDLVPTRKTLQQVIHGWR